MSNVYVGEFGSNPKEISDNFHTLCEYVQKAEFYNFKISLCKPVNDYVWFCCFNPEEYYIGLLDNLYDKEYIRNEIKSVISENKQIPDWLKVNVTVKLKLYVIPKNNDLYAIDMAKFIEKDFNGIL